MQAVRLGTSSFQAPAFIQPRAVSRFGAAPTQLDEIYDSTVEVLNLSYQIMKVMIKGFNFFAIPFWVSVLAIIPAL